MAKSKFIVAPGAPLTKAQAAKYGRELHSISKRNGGALKPDMIVAEAKEAASPLHDYFEWDTKKAAAKWRKQQARMLMSWIHVEPVGGGASIRQYHNVHDLEECGGGKIYVGLDRIAEEPYFRQQVLDNAMREIERWTERYERYSEIKPIKVAVKKVRRKLVKV